MGEKPMKILRAYPRPHIKKATISKSKFEGGPTSYGHTNDEI